MVFVIFLVLCFGQLAIGGSITGDAVQGSWYQNLNKAPWTPPGWVFGAAWSTIMLCFAIYMTKLWTTVNSKNLIIALFVIQAILNVAWNPMFFSWHYVVFALVNLLALLILLIYFFSKFKGAMGKYNLLLVPYLIWMCVAVSLNLYVLVYN